MNFGIKLSANFQIKYCINEKAMNIIQMFPIINDNIESILILIINEYVKKGSLDRLEALFKHRLNEEWPF